MEFPEQSKRKGLVKYVVVVLVVVVIVVIVLALTGPSTGNIFSNIVGVL